MVQQAFRVDKVSTSNIEFKSNSFISSIASDASLASNVHLVLPTSVGSSGQVLATDGSGNLSFVSQGVGGPADLVQDNVNSLTSTVDSFGVYANNTFGAGGSNVSVANVTSQEFSIDGSTNTFTLVNTTDNVNKLLVSYGGIAQKPSEYIVSNTSLTLSNTRPLVSGTTVEVRYLDFEFSGSVGAGGGGVISGTSYSSTLYSNTAAGITTFNDVSTPALPSYTIGKIGVYVNGVKLSNNAFSASTGDSVVLDNATLLGDDVEIVNFGVSNTPLNDLTDVDLTTNSPVNGQALVYVSANSKWEPGTVASSYGNSDVNLHLNQSTASTDQVLSWDGSDYVWVDQSAGGSSTPALTEYEFITTANQTSFAATYIPGSIQLFLNGVKLANTEFTATTGSSIVLGSNTAPGDIVSISKIGGSSNLTVSNASASSTGSISYDNGSEVLTYTPPDLSGYQSTLVSNTNIKTINGDSILGSGDITISAGGGIAGTLGSLTKSFANNESSTITLSSNVSPVPNVSVFKEVPQSGFSSKGNWDVNANATNYDFYDEKPISYSSATLTPSATGDGTFTLSSGAFNSSDVGKKVVGNSGSAIITSTAGAYKSVTPFADTSAISSWQLFGAQGRSDGSGVELSSAIVGGGAIDLDNISYTNNSFSVPTTNTYGMSFGNGGLRLYYLRSNNNSIYQYDLSTAYDITSATSTGDFQFHETPVDVNFNSSGTKMYLIGSNNKIIFEHTLSTPWDVTTASLDRNSIYLPNSISSGYIEDLAFKPDGTKCYVLNRVTNYIHQFNLSTAWNISTGSLVTNLFVNIGSPISLEFNNTGTKLFVLAQNDRVKQLDLSTAWDLSTASLSSTTGPNFDTQDTSSRSFTFNNNGTKMYMFGATTDSVYQYSLSTAYSISTATYDNVSLSASSYSTDFDWAKFSPNGNYLYLALGNGYYSKLYKFYLSTAWNLSTASYVSNFSLHFNSDYLASSTYAIEFGNSGNNIYILERNGIYNKSLSSQNITDLNDSTTTMVNSLSISSAEANPYGIVFNNNGSKLYIMGGDKISEHNLSTAYDITTATYNNVYFDITSQISAYSSYFFDFNSDGTILLILDHVNDIIYQYSLSSAFDLSTVSYTGTSTNTISNEGTHTYGIEISDDDSSVFIIQTSSVNSVFEYNFESILANYNSYSPALTNSSTGQINSSSWVDINSMIADETKNDGDIFYAVSTDNRTSWGVAKGSDGVRKIAKNNSGTWQYNNNAGTLEGFDYANATTTGDTLTVDVSNVGIAGGSNQGIIFSGDGTKFYLVYQATSSNSRIYQVTLGTAWDLTSGTTKYTFDPSVTQISAGSIGFNQNGTALYIAWRAHPGTARYFKKFTLSTAWDLSTASGGVNSANLNSSGDFETCRGLTVGLNEEFIVTTDYAASDDHLAKFTFATAGDVTSSITKSESTNVTSYTNFPPVGLGNTQLSIAGPQFFDNGNKLFFMNYNYGGDAYIVNLTSAYDITSGTLGSTTGDISGAGTWMAYGVKPDGTKLYIFDHNSLSLIEYSTGNINYSTSETWVNGTNNNEHATLQQALGAQAFNRMNKAQLDAIADANHFSQDSADTLDLMIAPYAASGTSPISDGVTINYDAEALVKQAINGTDYEAYFPSSNSVSITSLAAQNLKIRII